MGSTWEPQAVSTQRPCSLRPPDPSAWGARHCPPTPLCVAVPGAGAKHHSLLRTRSRAQLVCAHLTAWSTPEAWEHPARPGGHSREGSVGTEHQDPLHSKLANGRSKGHFPGPLHWRSRRLQHRSQSRAAPQLFIGTTGRTCLEDVYEGAQQCRAAPSQEECVRGFMGGKSSTAATGAPPQPLLPCPQPP